MFKQWNMLLIILTYALMILGTFLTRSGVLSSVHAFAQSAIGPLFFGFIGITLVASLSLLLHRWNDLKSETQLQSMLSREALFLLNNLLFMGILVVCFWGVIFPLISELFTGQKVTVGPPFYERANAPLMAGLLLLMAIAPLSSWGIASVKTLRRLIWRPVVVAVLVLVLSLVMGIRNPFALIGIFLAVLVFTVTVYEYARGIWARYKRDNNGLFNAFMVLTARNRRRYGGYIIHIGVVMMAIGIIGIELFQSETQGTIPQGGQIELGAYTMTYDSLAVFDGPDGRNVARAVVSIDKNGKPVGELFPRRDFYYDSQQPMTIPGVRSTLEDDFYVLLVDWLPISSEGATFKVYHNPLVKWMWLGAWVFVIGTLVAAWPDKDPETARVRASRQKFSSSAAD
jgi:cytochrome c-type biogenesis protein CcmF